MLANFLELNSKANASKFRERKRKVLSSVHVLDKTCCKELSRCSRATTVKKCTKSMMHVQSCCFVNPNLLLFCRSRCFRRRRCLSFVISGSNGPSEKVVLFSRTEMFQTKIRSVVPQLSLTNLDLMPPTPFKLLGRISQRGHLCFT